MARRDKLMSLEAIDRSPGKTPALRPGFPFVPYRTGKSKNELGNGSLRNVKCHHSFL
jgi:hypothetical protein